MDAGAKRKRTSRRRAPYVGPKCRACGYDTLVTPCACRDCMQWMILCGGCHDDELDRYVEAEGRCPYCRAQ